MSPLLLVGAAAAVIALAVLNWLLGGWRPARLADLDAARARLAADQPAFAVSDGVLAPDGRAALLLDEAGARVGLVLAMGDRFVTRAARPGEIRRIEVGADGALTLRFADYTLPNATLRLDSEADARAWADRVRALETPDA